MSQGIQKTRKLTLAIVLVMTSFGLSHPLFGFWGEDQRGFYQIFFTEDEWLSSHQPLPPSLVEPSTWTIPHLKKIPLVFGVYPYKSDANFDYISDRTSIRNRLKQDEKKVLQEIQRFFQIVADRRFSGVLFDVNRIAMDLILINDHYLYRDQSPEMTRTMIEGAYGLFLHTRNAEKSLHPDRPWSEPALKSYQDYWDLNAFDTAKESQRTMPQFLGVLNYFAYRFLTEVEGQLKGKAKPPELLRIFADIHYFYGDYAGAVEPLEALFEAGAGDGVRLKNLVDCYTKLGHQGFHKAMVKAEDMELMSEQEVKEQAEKFQVLTRYYKFDSTVKKRELDKKSKEWVQLGSDLLDQGLTSYYQEFLGKRPEGFQEGIDSELLSVRHQGLRLVDSLGGHFLMMIVDPSSGPKLILNQRKDIMSFGSLTEAYSQKYPKEPRIYSYYLWGAMGRLSIKIAEGLQEVSQSDEVDLKRTLVAITSEWEELLPAVKKVSYTEAQKNVTGLFEEVYLLVKSLAEDPLMSQDFGDVSFFFNPKVKKAWKKLKPLFAKTMVVIRDQEKGDDPPSYNLDEILSPINEWFQEEDSLAKAQVWFDQISRPLQEKDVEDVVVARKFLTSLLKDRSIFEQFFSQVDDSDRQSRGIGEEFGGQIFTLLDLVRDFLGTIEQQKEDLGDHLWKLPLDEDLFEKAKGFKERFIINRAIQSYMKAFIMFNAYDETQKVAHLNGACQQIYKTLDFLSDRRGEVQMMRVGVNNDQFRHYVYQNLGYCLYQQGHQDAQLLVDAVAGTEEDRIRALGLSFDRLIVGLKDDVPRQMEIAEKLLNNEAMLQSLGEKHRLSYQKRVLEWLIHWAKVQGKQEDLKRYQEMLPPLKEAEDVPRGKLDAKIGFGTSTGFFMMLELKSYRYLELRQAATPSKP